MQKVIEDLRKARSKSELLLLRGELERKQRELKSIEEKLDEKEALINQASMEASKSVEFNSQSYASFYNTKLEKDKSILTLSVAGLGFLITFTNFASNLGYLEFILFFISAICYLICIYNVITIFEKNALYIIAVTTDDDRIDKLEIQLKKHDKWAIKLFYSGIILSFILGFSASVKTQIEGTRDMTNENQPTEQTEVLVGESFDGSRMMRPKGGQSNPKQSTKQTPNTKTGQSNG